MAHRDWWKRCAPNTDRATTGDLSMTQPTVSVIHRSAVGPLQAFQQAAAFHRQGRVREAEPLYQVVLETQPRHFDALYSLGLIRLQQNGFADAADLFRRAIKVEKASAEAHY